MDHIKSSLSATLTDSSLSFSVVSGGGGPFPNTLGDGSHRIKFVVLIGAEKLLINSHILDDFGVETRGYESTSAVEHDENDIVELLQIIYIPISEGDWGGALAGQYASTEYTDVVESGSVQVNWDDGNIHYIQLDNGVNEITLINPLSGGRYILNLKQPASGAAGTVTIDPSPIWAGASEPTLTATNDAVDVITFEYSPAVGKYIGSALLDVKA